MARAIMVSDEVYRELTELKRPGESYSKVIHKFIHPQKHKKSFMEFAGAWSSLSDEEAEELKSSITKMRKKKRVLPKW